MCNTYSKGAKHRAFLLSLCTYCLQGFSGSRVNSSGCPVLMWKDDHMLLTLRTALKNSLHNMQNSLLNKQNHFNLIQAANTNSEIETGAYITTMTLVIYYRIS